MEPRNPQDNDLDRLSRLKPLSWLSVSELGLLAGALALTNFKRPQVIFREAALASDAHILLQGIARIICRNIRGERVTVALLPPGPIPEFPALPFSRFDFRCEAYNDCRVGSLGWNDFNGIAGHSAESVFKNFIRTICNSGNIWREASVPPMPWSARSPLRYLRQLTCAQVLMA
jgi:hypothetical protein